MGLLMAAVAIFIRTALLSDRTFTIQPISAAAQTSIVGGLADYAGATGNSDRLTAGFSLRRLGDYNRC